MTIYRYLLFLFAQILLNSPRLLSADIQKGAYHSKIIRVNDSKIATIRDEQSNSLL